MIFKTLEIKNFRCFEALQLELSERFTLLIGDNGSGKTAILDAFATLIEDHLITNSGITTGNRLSKNTNSRYALDNLGQAIIKEKVGDTLLRAEYLDNNSKYKTISTYELPNKNILIIKEGLLPVISYYGTDRLWQKTTDYFDTLPPEVRIIGYEDCLQSASNFNRFFRWFKTQEIAVLQKKEKRHALEAVRKAIINMVPDAKHVYWEVDYDEIMIETENAKNPPTPFHLLSDGYRNLIGVAADIAYRMATLNPQLGEDVIKETGGIVLIDEIDLHLHPKWQREVVGRLLKTFPKVQFVASSHSPFIIQSLYHRDDVLLWDLEKAAPVTIESKSIEDIAENQQGVEMPQQSQRFLNMEQAAKEYYEVLQGLRIASDEEKQQLKQKLDELLEPYSDDPAFQAFLKMERLAAIGDENF
jgi:predicted ATP-binding protein involved in virulence